MTFDDILTLQGPLAGLAALTWVIVEAIEQWQPTLEKRWLPVIAVVVAEALAHGVALTFGLYPLSAAWFVGIVCALGAVGGNSGVRAVAGR